MADINHYVNYLMAQSDSDSNPDNIDMAASSSVAYQCYYYSSSYDYCDGYFKHLQALLQVIVDEVSENEISSQEGPTATEITGSDSNETAQADSNTDVVGELSQLSSSIMQNQKQLAAIIAYQESQYYNSEIMLLASFSSQNADVLRMEFNSNYAGLALARTSLADQYIKTQETILNNVIQITNFYIDNECIIDKYTIKPDCPSGEDQSEIATLLQNNSILDNSAFEIFQDMFTEYYNNTLDIYRMAAEMEVK